MLLVASALHCYAESNKVVYAADVHGIMKGEVMQDSTGEQTDFCLI
jgi:hypothetical protein